MTRSRMKFSLAGLALLACALPLAADIPFLWLDSPTSRSNPNDPKSPLFMTATPQPTLPVTAATATATRTVSPTNTPSPSVSPSPTETLFLSPTSSPTDSPVVSSTDTPTATPSPSASDTATPSPSPSDTPTPAINGVWPILSNFEGDEFGNTALGTNFSFDDNGDGCGASASTTSFSRVAGTSWDGSACLQYDYTVAVNAGCGYEYAALAMPLVSPQDISAYNGLRFYVKGAVGGEAFTIRISTGAYVDPCLGTRNELSYNYSATTTSWQLVQIPFSSFINKDLTLTCPYLPSNAAFTQSLQFVITALGSGTVFIDVPEFATVSIPSNGAWPVVTNFEADADNNNAGGTATFMGNDNEEGCGPSLSAQGWSWASSGSWDGSAYGSLTYTVDTNVGCGYQYMYFGFDTSGQPDLTAYTGLRFYARDSGGGNFRVQIESSVLDTCISPPTRNKMYVDLAIVPGWTQYDLPFSTFTDRYMIPTPCPFISGGWLTQTSALTFIKTAVTSGALDLDLIEYY